MHCLLLLLTTFNCKSYDEKPIIPFVYNTIPVVQDLQLQKYISTCRLIMMPTILAISLYFNKLTLAESISKHPLVFLAISYLAGNYLIDSVSKYRQLNQTLQFFIFSQTMSRYMLCLLAVKNTMKHISEKQNLYFNEQEFTDLIIKNTGHSLEELELFTFELLNSSIHAVQNLCIDINTTDMEEKIYYLFKEQMSLEQMLLLCQKYPVLYKELFEFYQTPDQKYHQTLQKLCFLIQTHFNHFIKKKLHFI